MKCVGIQYLEAIRRLKASGFKPKRSVYLSYVPDEEIGGHDGAEKLAESDVFKGLNVGIVLDEAILSNLCTELVWVLFEWLNYHFLTLVGFALILGMLAQFLCSVSGVYFAMFSFELLRFA
ncbi:hypothetical protein ACFX11_038753 [Malus domestica]